MIDIVNLPYPMFITSPEEKELLRKVELAVVNKPLNQFFAICAELDKFNHGDMPIVMSIYPLKRKIAIALANNSYIHSRMLEKSSELRKYYWSLNVANRYVLNRYIRLVWITKLLNYTGK